jgi:pyridinium-3,5-bisthiocarboxylic acid mononucleotide nickel chelatase
MRVAHLDCFSGISGDMTLAALIDAGVDADAIRQAIASFQLPIQMHIERVKRCGMAATYVDIQAADEENYRFLPDVEAILDRGALTANQRALAKSIFRKLATAEAHVHGMPLKRVHFHEVGALDSIADIAGAAVGFDLLGVERITCSSVPPGSGTMKCAHGLMPIPAPATAELLKGMPLARSPVVGELVTPTGAAILATVVHEFTNSPVMTIERIGWGAGKKDFDNHPNCLRLMVGHAEAGSFEEQIWQLETNLDDIPGQQSAYTLERLLEAGALDVTLTPTVMKKGRPGLILCVLANLADREALEQRIFTETGTLGIRRQKLERTVLARDFRTVATPYGPVRVKRGHRAGFQHFAPEYADCAARARESGTPLHMVYHAALTAAQTTVSAPEAASTPER